MSNSDQGNTTRVIQKGKLKVTLYPEVQFIFMSELNKHHQDLIRLMQLAQVSFADGSAVQYLNQVLGTHVKPFDPMEIGYAILLDAIRSRVVNQLSIDNTERVAKEHLRELTSGAARDSSEIGKPLFPTWDEEKENADRRDKH